MGKRKAKAGGQGGVRPDTLGVFVQRIENVEAERKALAEDLKEIYGEVKEAELSPKIVRKLVAERRRDKSLVSDERELLDLYREQMDSFESTPLGGAAADPRPEHKPEQAPAGNGAQTAESAAAA